MSGTVTPTHVYQISNARLVTFDGFVPVPRGAIAAPPVMPSWPVKDPGDVLDYVADFSSAIQGDLGDSLATFTAASSPNSTGDVVINSAAFDGTQAVLWLSAGNSGTVYTVTLVVTMTSGRTISRSVVLPVYSLSGQSPTSVVLITNSGQDLTDQNGNPIVVGG